MIKMARGGKTTSLATAAVVLGLGMLGGVASPTFGGPALPWRHPPKVKDPRAKSRKENRKKNKAARKTRSKNRR